MATHDDYDGVYFTIQSIRMFHPEVLNDIEFIIIDNNPAGKHGKCIRDLLNWIKEPVQYLPFTKYNSTSIKNKIFSLADTPYVLSIDCHVLLEPGSIKKLIDFYDRKYDDGNLLQGPLVYDDFTNISTHMDLKWGGYMWGVWGTDDRGTDPDGLPFEIPAQGCGLFSCRKDAWLGFNPNFKGFGGEEGYIQEKYRKSNKKTLCLPFLRWMHRFSRPDGIHYPNNLQDRYKNYILGFSELGLDLKEVKEVFGKDISTDEMSRLDDEVRLIQPF